jgi:DNA-binding CsgD family transcriptional regulator
MTLVISCVEPMARLSQSDLGQALDFLREAERIEGPEPFPSELLDRLRDLVGCDSVSYCELDRPGERMLLYEGCARAREVEASLPFDAVETFWRLRHQHPVCVYQDRTNDFAARTLSDFLTGTQLHALEIYDEFFRPYEVEYELEVGLTAPPTHTKVFLLDRRSRDFTSRDRLLVEVLRPHFASLYSAARNRRVLAALEARQEPADRVVMPGRNGTVDFAGSRARDLLDDYFERDLPERLPEVVHDWLCSETDLARRDTALTVAHGDRRLVVRHVGDVLLLREEPAGLTSRESEILDLVADGFTNAEIAKTLWVSAGTVRIHLQHIYEKLGVRNRTAAAAHLRQSGRA